MITFVTVWFLMASYGSGYGAITYTIPYSSKESCLVAKDVWNSKSVQNEGHCWSGEMPVYVNKK